MSYSGRDRMGAYTRRPTMAQMKALLESLDPNDTEHPDVALSHESGWTISVFPNGHIIFENMETKEGPWHMAEVSMVQTLYYWQLLAAGKIKEIMSMPGWEDSYGCGNQSQKL